MNMKLFTINATPLRIEDDEQATIEKLTTYKGVVARVLSDWGIDGFTIYEVDGYWQGVAEKSFKIEIALEDEQKSIDTVGKVCAKLRDSYNQDAVMLTYPDGEVEFI